MAIFPSTGRRRDGSTRSRRWIAVLLASVALHLIAVNWAGGRFGMPMPDDAAPAVIAAALLTETPAPAPAVVAAAPKARPKIRKKRPVAPPPEPAAAPVPAPVPEPEPETPSASPSGIEAPGTSVETVAAAAPENVPAAAAAEPELAAGMAPQAVRYKADPPPPAELKYDVQALRNGERWYGKGMFRWETADGSYRITGEAWISFLINITVLDFKSEGVITDAGIAPVLYSEKPWRKALTNTHFQHANRKISFSASEAVYPWHGGEQDRASIMWQLAAIGRGDAGQFAPGTEIDIMVAGARNAETWRIRVIGQEEVETASGRLAAWHVARAPNAGSHDQTIDIWLAPQQEWYPVRLRYTYANGDYLDMSLSDMTTLAPLIR